ncbi:MAG: hypothetical protein JXQ23_09730 [Clostridia bacterium]|nr:hypothetical protein [Clostridia bacterium]
MIYDNLEFYNVEELYEKDNIPGKILGRFNLKTMNLLDSDHMKNGKAAASYSNECEIRFVTVRKSVRLYLSALETDGKINVYHGDYFNGTYDIHQGKINCITLTVNDRLYETEERATNPRYSKEVWRIVFLKRFTAIYHGIDVSNEKVRPPVKNELPSKTFLAYGSSISFGATSGKESDLSYIQIAARKLKYQVLNKSMPGSCFCEKAVTDFITEINEADFYLYEIGGNMRNRYTVDEFKERFTYLMDETLRKQGNKPVFIIDVFWTLRNIPFENQVVVNDIVDGYNQVMVQYIRNRPNENLILIDNKKIITDYSLMCADMIHPSPYGSIIMGENLYHEMSKYLL